ncbi:TlpA family protein disulfide reductase [Flavobacterium sp. CBA20B-1]|uniref:TlpA family protein disulfide reductase n=1 Tax=unclassified Flavobacterium TaxID=196869 RepID=UPI0022251F62|nr:MULTISPECIES: TlpA disulfide reductase family protein [unclassified Flavobacterium]WCM41074.1 TlpA family protein disulfide reductase [Flavobacterium sp. CBA20B-1]
MKQFSKPQFILLSIVVLIVMIGSGSFLHTLYRLFLTSVFFLLSSFFLFSKSPFSKKTTSIIIFLPILLLYTSMYIYDLFYDEGFIGKPFFWNYLLVAVLVYVNNVYKISKTKIIAFFIPFCLVLTAYVYYSRTENEKNKIETSQLKRVTFLDEKGNEVPLNSFQGKLTLFEFWTTSCAQCPESISKFHELAEQYKSNKNIDFKVVNINLGKRHNEKIFKKIESSITLEKLYASELIFKQLNFNVAPTVLVIDPQGKIVYFGYPNFKKLTRNYLPNIIEEELTKM